MGYFERAEFLDKAEEVLDFLDLLEPAQRPALRLAATA